MSDRLIYLYRDGKQLGPFPEAEISGHLKSGLISEGDLAWCEGETEWRALELVLDKKLPPPTPTNVSTEKSYGCLGAFLAFLAVVAAATVKVYVSDLPKSVQLQLVGGTISGLLCGLIPFFYGKNRHDTLRKWGFGASTITGALMGLTMAFPMAFTFTWVLSKYPKRGTCERNT